MPRNDQLIDKWNRWIKIIYKDLQGLLIMRHIFWEVQEIIKRNDRIQKRSTFYKWMGSTYSASVSVGIRRQVDERRDSVSLLRLLSDMKRNPTALTRERHRSLYSPENLKVGLADRCFDKYSGTGKAHADANKIEADIEKLKTATAEVKHYVDKSVAHMNASRLTRIPKFRNVDFALNLLEGLLKKYLLLLHADAHTSILPVWQYDWKAIFREPWIRGD
jgi:hypothetical protein